ncbi:MAG: IS1 family transposase [Spirochaetales bacterium]|nr:IS1 family transposase [Candidatus Physcosoma equi]
MSKNIIDEKNISTTFSTLKDYQKTKIVKAISEYLSINERNANIAFDSCPKCGFEDAYITRCGHTKGGKQMLLCHSCGRKFVEDTGKPSFHSWYDATVWESFISDTISGQTLAFSEEKLGIDHSTAWRWRHKVMEAVSTLEVPILLGKSAKVDEKYFRKSHKGREIEGVPSKKRTTPVLGHTFTSTNKNPHLADAGWRSGPH